MTKTEWREKLLQIRAVATQEERILINKAVAKHLLELEAYRKSDCIFVYCSTEGEIDTRQIIGQALQNRKTVCVPRCTKKGQMIACRIETVSSLIPGKFGILEPPENGNVINPTDIDLCIVPCLGADVYGFRIGYGGGYYDRFLPLTQAETIILCAENRYLPALPHDQYDISCQQIITERRVYFARQE